ncbi:MAG: 6-phosphofructokinase, partial [Thermoplasmata archaeon]|nr:6-phosphofructokinase [Thermoplasmata archaeon]
PKTIDNDLSGTDRTFGFDTAVNIAVDALDRLHTTAESHSRVLVAELMGRKASWITLCAGMAAGADVILIPEVGVSLDDICGIIRKRYESGKEFSIVAVSEGFKLAGEFVTQDKSVDQFGNIRLGGTGHMIAKEIEKKTGFETRTVVLGHIQRGGSPTAYDRYLGLRFGVRAIELVRDGQFGKMVGLKGNDFVPVPLSEAAGKLRTVDPELYELSKTFFG